MSKPPGADRVLAAIDDAEVLQLLQELIRQPSENPPGNEAATVAVLAKYFRAQGIPFRLDELAPGRPNLLAEIGSGDGPLLVFNGHTDTVPFGEGWTRDPVGAELDAGNVYGRGACDMLGGVASMSAAVAAIHRSGVDLPDGQRPGSCPALDQSRPATLTRFARLALDGRHRR